MIGIRNRREEGTLFALQPFFLFDSQVIRIFCLKDRLIILKAVTYVVGHLLRDDSRLEEDMLGQ